MKAVYNILEHGEIERYRHEREGMERAGYEAIILEQSDSSKMVVLYIEK